MPRKRLTQLFPWLLPLRRRQRLFCFYAKMRFDRNRYAKTLAEKTLPYLLFESGCPLYNTETGFDMVYQHNKVFNLKLAADTLDALCIRPGETFSFWQLVRFADKHTSFKEGLTVQDGKLVITRGGGMCQMSNLLFWMFLHTPLTIVERHTHRVKDFPSPPSDAPEGVDATVSEGWLDLKVRNDTHYTFQLRIAFDQTHIYGRVYCDQQLEGSYHVYNKALRYVRRGGKMYEHVDVLQQYIAHDTGALLAETRLYENVCQIGYALAEDTPIIEGDA
nr:glycopeptide resistance accessory protein VanW [Maliibacterium massiliense]